MPWTFSVHANWRASAPMSRKQAPAGLRVFHSPGRFQYRLLPVSTRQHHES